MSADANRVGVTGGGDDVAAGSRVLDGVLTALADPTQRLLLKLLSADDEVTATSLAGPLPMTRQAVVANLSKLDTAGLVIGRRVGHEVRYALRPEALIATARWLGAFASGWDECRPAQAPP